MSLYHRLSVRLVLIGLLLTAVKLVLATRLDLYSDEIFYWFESTKPALAYSDLPFMSALLAGVGPELFGNSALAVRLPFLLIGSLTPVLVFWLGRPLVGSQQAREAALLVFCLPLASSLGLLAVPDVPLIALGLLSVGLFLRAYHSDSWTHWLATGLVVALGFSTHYRFVLFPFAACLFLVFEPAARRLLSNPRAIAAGLLAATGLAPILWFNLTHDMASAAFYLVDRHPWAFSSAGLAQPLIQALVATPLLYALLLYTAYCLSKELRSAINPGKKLLGLVGLLHLLVYTGLAPFSDPTSTTVHWPLAGLIPLLVYAPSTLRELCSRQPRFKSAPGLLVAMGLLGSALALLGVGSQSLHSQLQPLIGADRLSAKMAGWDAFTAATSAKIASEFTAEPLLVTDNYYTAAQIAFAAGTRAPSQPLTNPKRLFSLDSTKAVRDGRAAQLALWEMDARALAQQQDRDALFITEDSTLNFEQKDAVLRQACAIASDVFPLGHATLLGGAKRYSYYRLRLGPAGTACPLPARAWIDSPRPGEVLSGDSANRIEVKGWAFAENTGVSEIKVSIDGVAIRAGVKRTERADVEIVDGARRDPDYPLLGFSALLESGRLEAGSHSLEIVARNGAGEVSVSLSRQFVVEHSADN